MPAPLPLNQLLSIPYAEYAAASGINKSGLDQVLRSPAHFRAYREGLTDETSPELEQGRITHACVLEPDEYARLAQIKPKLSKRKEEEWASEIFESQPDAMLVSEKQHEMAMRQRDAVWNNRDAAALLSKGEREASLFWQDPIYGVRCKARLDFVSRASSKGICVDLKTTRDATRAAFARSVVTYNYDMQASHYLEGGSQSGQYGGDDFFFIVVEKKPPFATVVYSMSAWAKTRGFKWREEAMSIYSQSFRSNQWPGLPTTDEITLPKWAKVPGEEEENAE